MWLIDVAEDIILLIVLEVFTEKKSEKSKIHEKIEEKPLKAYYRSTIFDKRYESSSETTKSFLRLQIKLITFRLRLNFTSS